MHKIVMEPAKREQILWIIKATVVPRARLELARRYNPTQDFKSCASTYFATGALLTKLYFAAAIK